MDIIQDYIKKVLPGRGWIKAGSQVKFSDYFRLSCDRGEHKQDSQLLPYPGP